MARQQRKKMSLHKWIDLHGKAAIARKLGVDPATVWYWRHRSFPSAKMMKKIKRVTQGMVGYDQILDG